MQIDEQNLTVEVITYATSEQFYMKWLKESCKRNGCELTVLGNGNKWNSYMDKIYATNDYLNQTPNNRIVCLIDAYDVLMCKDVNKLKEDFLNLVKTNGNKIIIAQDKSLSLFNEPIPIISDFHKFSSLTLFKNENNVNAGAYISYSSDLKEMFEYTIKKSKELNNNDDQCLINIYLNEFPDKFYIDTDNKFIICSFEILDLPEYNKDVYFLHKPGYGFLINYLKAHGYEITPEEEIDIILKSTSSIGNKISYHTQNFLKNILK